MDPASITLLASRYALRRQIGHGATSRVYLADDLETGTPVAVKILHPELAVSTTAARFRREIRFLTELRHPNLLPILDSGDDGDLLFLVTPHVSGESLATRLARVGKLELAEAIGMLRAIAAGLDYAHEHGVVHRDIKPANILLGERVLLCDFGIARALLPTAGDQVSSSGLVIGTLEYMSPEQAGGDRPIDGQADIYALGCVAFEMLVGEPPFTGPSSQVLIGRHLREPPRPIRSVRPDAPPSFERAIHAAMSKEPRSRPRSGAAFVAMMEDVEA